MRVKVTVTVDIDPDAWSLEHGIPRAEVAADAREYLARIVRQHVADLGCEAGPA